MNARLGCSPMPLALAAGQVQRVLVDAGSMLVVTQGALTVRFPFAWLAGNVVSRELALYAEAAHRLEDGGWIDLMAEGEAEAVILAPDSEGLWVRAGVVVEQVLARLRASRSTGREMAGQTRITRANGDFC